MEEVLNLKQVAAAKSLWEKASPPASHHIKAGQGHSHPLCYLEVPSGQASKEAGAVTCAGLCRTACVPFRCPSTVAADPEMPKWEGLGEKSLL